jgi:membrane protein implicated in regulation of membrane protease activity
MSSFTTDLPKIVVMPYKIVKTIALFLIAVLMKTDFMLMAALGLVFTVFLWPTISGFFHLSGWVIWLPLVFFSTVLGVNYCLIKQGYWKKYQREQWEAHLREKEARENMHYANPMFDKCGS